MKSEQALEPPLAVAEERYATILASILAYTQFCDTHGDDDNTEYDRLADQLQALSGKDIPASICASGGKRRARKCWRSGSPCPIQ